MRVNTLDKRWRKGRAFIHQRRCRVGLPASKRRCRRSPHESVVSVHFVSQPMPLGTSKVEEGIGFVFHSVWEKFHTLWPCAKVG